MRRISSHMILTPAVYERRTILSTAMPAMWNVALGTRLFDTLLRNMPCGRISHLLQKLSRRQVEFCKCICFFDRFCDSTIRLIHIWLQFAKGRFQKEVNRV
jgi:hypothetical protein